MAESSAEALSEPQSLAHLLEFLARLEEKAEVKEKVITEIEEKVKGYVKDDGKFGNPTTGYLFETIKKSRELRKNIVASVNTYQHYTESFNNDANKYAKHMIDNVFPLFGCLYYMYYECAGECYGIGAGGQWYDNKCDGSGGGRDKKHLNQWLQDKTQTGTRRMIKRHFQQGELSQKEGKDLFGDRGQSSNLLYYTQGAQLQFALYYMLFLPAHTKWDNAQSGHAVLFLQAFCEEITGYQFDDNYTEADGGSFNNTCEKVRESIQKLLSSNTIFPVACSDTVKYKNLMDEKRFGSYITWLKENLPKLINSLTEMKDDVDNWTIQKMNTSSSYGPYPWGFTFESNWKWENDKEKVKQQLHNLSSSLNSLKNALPSAWKGKRRSKKPVEGPSNSTDSTASTASTVGGVAAGLGAAAGAAYAGSGILGPAAEAIGKFFRGLFL